MRTAGKRGGSSVTRACSMASHTNCVYRKIKSKKNKSVMNEFVATPLYFIDYNHFAALLALLVPPLFIPCPRVYIVFCFSFFVIKWYLVRFIVILCYCHGGKRRLVDAVVWSTALIIRTRRQQSTRAVHRHSPDCSHIDCLRKRHFLRYISRPLLS
jgi:hypothetical protein